MGERTKTLVISTLQRPLPGVLIFASALEGRGGFGLLLSRLLPLCLLSPQRGEVCVCVVDRQETLLGEKV